MDYQQGLEFLPVLDSAEKSLRPLLSDIPGAQVERKRFSIAVHYRNVAKNREKAVEEAVDRVLGNNARLRKRTGKKIFELQPEIDWHKGKALCRLLEVLERDRPDLLPIYIGDDVTDEDAFRELQAGGIGIVVKDNESPETSRCSTARYALNDCRQVQKFLEGLAGMLQGESR